MHGTFKTEHDPYIRDQKFGDCVKWLNTGKDVKLALEEQAGDAEFSFKDLKRRADSAKADYLKNMKDPAAALKYFHALSIYRDARYATNTGEIEQAVGYNGTYRSFYGPVYAIVAAGETK